MFLLDKIVEEKHRQNSQSEQSYTENHDTDKNSTDLFGIKRGRCIINGVQVCPRYQAQNSIFTNQQENFVTFCTNCNCPAQAHQKSEWAFYFPTQLLTAISSRKFTQHDLNYNATVAIFTIPQDNASHRQVIQLLSEFLREKGYTVLGFDQRSLTYEEVLLLKERGANFRSYQNMNATDKFKRAFKMKQSATSLKFKNLKTSKTLQWNLVSNFQRIQDKRRSKENILNLRKIVKLQNTKADVNVLSTVLRQFNVDDKYASNFVNFLQIDNEMDQQQEKILELTNIPCIILSLDSTLFHHLSLKFTIDIQNFGNILYQHGVSYLYSSQNKTFAIQDTLMFFPNLFKIQKSIVSSLAYRDIVPKRRANLINLMKRNINQMSPQPLMPDPQGKRDTIMSLQLPNIQSIQQERIVHQPIDAVLYNGSSIFDILNFNGVTVLSSLDSRGNRGGLYHELNRILSLRVDRNFGSNKLLESNQGTHRDYQQQGRFNNNNFGLQQFSEKPQGFNLFAIAKIGLPVLMTPFSLSTNIRTISGELKYLRTCDKYFPSLSKLQRTVIVFRPVSVKSGLNKLLKQILTVNDFIFLDSYQKILSEEEAKQLAKLEQIDMQDVSDYINLMCQSRVEVLVVFKYGAVHECNVLCNGCRDGKRKIGQIQSTNSIKQKRRLGEQLTKQDFMKQQKDSVRQMGTHQVSPFSSFNQLMNLDEFVISYSNNKYDTKGVIQSVIGDRIQPNQLIKNHRLLQDLNYFQRHFNVAAHTSLSEDFMKQEMQLLFNSLTHLQHFSVILNPIYSPSGVRGNNSLSQEAIDLYLKRMGYEVTQRKHICFTKQDCVNFFEKRYAQSNTELYQKMVEHFVGQQTQILMIVKAGGLLEIEKLFEHFHVDTQDYFKTRQLSCFRDNNMDDDALQEEDSRSQLNSQNDSYARRQPSILDLTRFRESKSSMDVPMLQLEDFPLLFLVCDTSHMQQQTVKILAPNLASFNGESILFSDKRIVEEILEYILQVTVGSKIRRCYIDSEFKAHDVNEDTASFDQRHLAEAQYLQLPLDIRQSDSTYFAVESAKFGPYQVRLKKNLQGKLNVEDQYDKLIQQNEKYNDLMVSKLMRSSIPDIIKHVRPEQKQALMYRYEIMSYFQTLNLYYTSVNKQCKDMGLCPSLYEFRILPLDKLQPANRVYQCQEFMGEFFLNRLAEDAIEFRKVQMQSFMDDIDQSTRGSLPAFLWAQKLAESCQVLQEVKVPENIQEKIGDAGYGLLTWSQEGQFKYEIQNIEAMNVISDITNALGISLQSGGDGRFGSKSQRTMGESSAGLNKLSKMLNKSKRDEKLTESRRQKGQKGGTNKSQAFEPLKFEKDFFRSTFKQAVDLVQGFNRRLQSADSKLDVLKQVEIRMEGILKSQAYLRSRKINMLRLVPERVTQINLRAKQRLQIFNQSKFQGRANQVAEDQAFPVKNQNLDFGMSGRSKSPLQSNRILAQSTQKEISGFISDIFLKNQVNRRVRMTPKNKQPTSKTTKSPFHFGLQSTQYDDQPKQLPSDTRKKKVAAFSLFRKANEKQPIAMQWNVAFTNIAPSVRSKYHLIASIIWLIDVRLRRFNVRQNIQKFKNNETFFNRVIDNMLQSIKQSYRSYALDKDPKTGEEIQIHVDGISFIKMELFLYGLRQIKNCMNEMNALKRNKDLINRQLMNCSAADIPKLKHKLGLIDEIFEQKKEEILLSLENLSTHDVFVDPSKYKGGANKLFIHRDRFFKPILHEYWEDDLEMEKYKQEVKKFNFPEKFVKIPELNQKGKTNIEGDWWNQPKYTKAGLYQHGHKINEWLAVKKKEAKSEEEYQRILRENFAAFIKARNQRTYDS